MNLKNDLAHPIFKSSQVLSFYLFNDNLVHLGRKLLIDFYFEKSFILSLLMSTKIPLFGVSVYKMAVMNVKITFMF